MYLTDSKGDSGSQGVSDKLSKHRSFCREACCVAESLATAFAQASLLATYSKLPHSRLEPSRLLRSGTLAGMQNSQPHTPPFEPFSQVVVGATLVVALSLA